MTVEELAQMPDRTKFAVVSYEVQGDSINATVQLPASQSTFISSGQPNSNFAGLGTMNLGWDQSTYMPPKGGAARGRQLALVERLAHERRIDPALGRLLDELQPFVDSLPPDDDRAAMHREARRSYERAVRTVSYTHLTLPTSDLV